MDIQKYKLELMQSFSEIKEHPFETHRIGFNEGYEKAIQLAIKKAEQLAEPRYCTPINKASPEHLQGFAQCSLCKRLINYESDDYCSSCGAKIKNS